MRTACFECVYKHLGEAAIWAMEVPLGYPEFALYVVGALSHASTEVSAVHNDLAMLIRMHRTKWMTNRTYRIPYLELGAYVQACLLLNELEPYPAIPEECYKEAPIKQE